MDDNKISGHPPTNKDEEIARKLSLAILLIVGLAIVCFPITLLLFIICAPCCIFYLCCSVWNIQKQETNSNIV